MFRELKGVEPLPVLPLEISAKVRPQRLVASRPFEVVIQLENVGTLPIRIRQLLAVLHTRYPRAKDNPEIDTLNFFSPYRREQLSLSIKQTRMGLTPTKAIDDPMTDSRDLHVASLFEIEPGGRFPLSLEFRDGLAADEYELRIQVLSLEETPLGRDQLTLPAVWIPLDVHPAMETPSAQPLAGFRVQEKRLYRDVNSQHLLEVKLLPQAEGPRKVVCQSGLAGNALPAGRIRALDPNGRSIPLRTHGSYTGNLQVHESWRMEAVPEGGLLIQVRFTRDAGDAPIQTIQLDLVSERGLERLMLGDIPASFQAVKFVKQDH
jgi:hypothetical protein